MNESAIFHINDGKLIVPKMYRLMPIFADGSRVTIQGTADGIVIESADGLGSVRLALVTD